ncbi:MAG: hypothetical protein LBJ47_00280, partial [Tannerella sp.]|nr:hypothetical protein [Tannerella sp.]
MSRFPASVSSAPRFLSSPSSRLPVSPSLRAKRSNPGTGYVAQAVQFGRLSGHRLCLDCFVPRNDDVPLPGSPASDSSAPRFQASPASVSPSLRAKRSNPGTGYVAQAVQFRR